MKYLIALLLLLSACNNPTEPQVEDIKDSASSSLEILTSSDVVISSSITKVSSSVEGSSQSLSSALVSSSSSVMLSSISDREISSSQGMSSSSSSQSTHSLKVSFREGTFDRLRATFTYGTYQLKIPNKKIMFQWKQKGHPNFTSTTLESISPSSYKLNVDSLKSPIVEYKMRLCTPEVDCDWNTPSNWQSGTYEVINWPDTTKIDTLFMSFYDTRGTSASIKYYARKIGKYMWMTENLNFGYGKIVTFQDQGFRQRAGQKFCPNNESKYCKNGYTTNMGGLYEWHIAMALPERCYKENCDDLISSTQHQGICPNGWHLPDSSEWDDLTTTLGGTAVAGKTMKTFEDSATTWNSPEYNDGNSSQFSVRPSGYADTKLKSVASDLKLMHIFGSLVKLGMMDNMSLMPEYGNYTFEILNLNISGKRDTKHTLSDV